MSETTTGPGREADRALQSRKPRLLIFIVAFHAEQTIGAVLRRIPVVLKETYDIEVLVIDDASADATFERGRELQRNEELGLPLRVLFNPVNQGYGGNQKVGYFYAIKNQFDFVALVHGDGQYAPESLPDLLAPLSDGQADACFGSRMMTKGGARAGGMPLYKFVGNRILSWFENRMLGTSFTEFHSGYRIYSVAALRKVPFDLNSNDFHFDTEIIIQFVIAGLRIVERPIPTYYGDEISRVNGLRYAWNVTRAVIKARVQRLGIFYDRRFDCAPDAGQERYPPKLDFASPQALALDMIAPGSRVLDLGCAGGHLGHRLRQTKGCRVHAIDLAPLADGVTLDSFRQHDLNSGLPDLGSEAYDHVLLLDVIEHLSNPERFVTELYGRLAASPQTRVVVSTGNIGFLPIRIMLMLGQFNYGKRGILDLTHTRLFTYSSLRRLFEQCRFHIVETRGVAAPFALFSDGLRARFLTRLNTFVIRISKRLFAYQIFIVVQPYPALDYLLHNAERSSARRAEQPPR